MKIFTRTFKIAIFICVISIFQTGVYANDSIDNKSKNAVYFELFGNAPYLYNLSYDRVIISHNSISMTLALGAQIGEYSSMSPQINFLYGEKHNLELGLGYYHDFNYESRGDKQDNGLVLRLGYRYQKMTDGLFFKIAVTPIISGNFAPTIGTVVPWGGIAVGWSF